MPVSDIVNCKLDLDKAVYFSSLIQILDKKREREKEREKGGGRGDINKRESLGWELYLRGARVRK